jgi:hypothetical protein
MNRQLHSSIAINQKKNNNIINNGLKLINNALFEKIRERDTEIIQLKTLNDKLLAKIEKHKIQKQTP